MANRATPDRPLSLSRETLAAIAKLNIETRRAVEGLLGGNHWAMHQGPSVEFSEHRRYTTGDDLRNLDWKAMARTDRLFIKSHEQEAHLTCMMMVDNSASMNYRGSRASCSKLEMAQVLAGAMAHLLLQNDDKVGLITLSNNVTGGLGPSRHATHLQDLLTHLATHPPASRGKPAIHQTITRATKLMDGRGLFLVFTDLLDWTDQERNSLAGLAGLGHDLVVFHILSPDEQDLPFTKRSDFVCPETGRTVTTDPATTRAHYKAAIASFIDDCRTFCGNAGIEFVWSPTSLSPANVIFNFSAGRVQQGVGP